jgi:hypothetical protein
LDAVNEKDDHPQDTPIGIQQPSPLGILLRGLVFFWRAERPVSKAEIIS